MGLSSFAIERAKPKERRGRSSSSHHRRTRARSVDGLHRRVRRLAHPVWRVMDVLAYFEAHGLQVTEDWNAPA